MNVEVFKKSGKNTLTTELEAFFVAHPNPKFLDIEFSVYVDKGVDWYAALIVYQD